MRVSSNIPAMTASRNFETHQGKAAVSAARLSSGKRINSAADDPAGMAISQKFKAQLRELGVRIRVTEAERDEADARSAEATQRQDMLNRLREIAVHVSSDSLTEDDKRLLMEEYTELIKEFSDSTYRNTGMELAVFTSGERTGELVYKSGDKVYMDGKWTDLAELLQSDSEPFVFSAGEELSSETAVVRPEAHGAKDINNAADSKAPTMSLIDYVDSLISRNLSSLSGFGAASSSLSKKLDRLFAEELNAASALSRIEDADIVKEMLEFIKENMLSQTAIFAAAQANALPEQVLTLLEAV